MAAATIPHYTPTVAEAQHIAPQLAVVADSPSPKINYVAIYASSIFAVAMVFLLGVGVPLAIVTNWTEGMALGAFCAIWGGPSFGVMTGSARVSAWNERYGTDH